MKNEAMTGVTTRRKLNAGKVILALLMAANAVLCYFGCIQETMRWYPLGDLIGPTEEVTFRWLCAPFVTVMTLLRMIMLWRNKAGLHKFSWVLSIVVAVMVSAWTIILTLSRPIYGGLGSTAFELTTVGWVAVVLAWVIVALQLGLFLWAKNTDVFPEYAFGAAKSNVNPGIWILVAILVLLVLVVFRVPLLELFIDILNLSWPLF